MSLPPILLSDLIIQHPEVYSFADLLSAIRKRAELGERYMLEVDLKPDFPDTPRNWEFLVEEAFVWGER
ncbi:MAG: sulfur relay protein DsrC [Rhodospirillales bacterium]|nr:sulfur relay protein DsrC [Alphaproteobacteria bacterium]MBL6948220.1 sulfur relay protein DsrC [Rhodospirillales bacterium]